MFNIKKLYKKYIKKELPDTSDFHYLLRDKGYYTEALYFKTPYYIVDKNQKLYTYCDNCFLKKETIIKRSMINAYIMALS
jgi:hypothetical protein